jgi:hypothetical protein
MGDLSRGQASAFGVSLPEAQARGYALELELVVGAQSESN